MPINIVAVFAAAVAAFIIGFLFHGPLFGTLWMRLADVHPTGNEKFSDMYGQLFWNFISNVVSAAGLSVVYLFASTSTVTSGPGIMTGILCGIIVWLGFQVTVTSIEVIWMKRSVALWLFECVSALVTFVSMGAIIALL